MNALFNIYVYVPSNITQARNPHNPHARTSPLNPSSSHLHCGHAFTAHELRPHPTVLRPPGLHRRLVASRAHHCERRALGCRGRDDVHGGVAGAVRVLLALGRLCERRKRARERCVQNKNGVSLMEPIRAWLPRTYTNVEFFKLTRVNLTLGFNLHASPGFVFLQMGTSPHASPVLPTLLVVMHMSPFAHF